MDSDALIDGSDDDDEADESVSDDDRDARDERSYIEIVRHYAVTSFVWVKDNIVSVCMEFGETVFWVGFVRECWCGERERERKTERRKKKQREREKERDRKKERARERQSDFGLHVCEFCT